MADQVHILSQTIEDDKSKVAIRQLERLLQSALDRIATLESDGGSGSGAVSSVTGGGPISVSPTTGAVVVSFTGAYGVSSVTSGSAGLTVSPTTGSVVVSLAGPLPTVSGTLNKVAKFTGTNTVGDSSITDTGSLITLTQPTLATQLRGTVQTVTTTGVATVTLNADTTVVRFNPASQLDMIGLTGGVDGRVVFLENIGVGNVLLYDEHASASPADRIKWYSPGGFGYLVNSGGHAMAIYDGSTSRWRVSWMINLTPPTRLDVIGEVTATGNFTTSLRMNAGGQRVNHIFAPYSNITSTTVNNWCPHSGVSPYPIYAFGYVDCSVAIGNTTITGFDAGAAGDGDILVIYNRTGFTWTLKHQDAGSLAANRWNLFGGVDAFIDDKCGAHFQYVSGVGWQQTSFVRQNDTLVNGNLTVNGDVRLNQTSGTTVAWRGIVVRQNTASTYALDVAKGSSTTAAAVITGTVESSYFHNGTNEDTYIRPGKAAGIVYIGDFGTAVYVGQTGIPVNVPGNLVVNGNATLGDASGDTHTVNGNLTFSNTPTAGPIKYGSLNARMFLKIQRLDVSAISPYVPSTGTKAVRLRMVGGGGGGGGAGGGAGQAAGGGGSSGQYIDVWIDAASNITGGAFTLGAAGTAGASTPGDGGAGGDTTITINGTLYTARGGAGGKLMASTTTANNTYPQGLSAAVTGPQGDFTTYGPGGYGVASSSLVASGNGGSNPLGGGGCTGSGSGVAGKVGIGFGAGGSGGQAGAGSVAGGAGTAGLIIIEEYA